MYVHTELYIMNVLYNNDKIAHSLIETMILRILVNFL